MEEQPRHGKAEARLSEEHAGHGKEEARQREEQVGRNKEETRQSEEQPMVVLTGAAVTVQLPP